MENRRVRIVISGVVQGVFFRYNIRLKAGEFNVKGWGKNCADGKVEAVFEGNYEDIEKMVAWCRQGPLGARVEDVVVNDEEYRGEFNSFFIK